MRATALLAIAILALAGCSSPAPADPPQESGPTVITAPDEGLNDTREHFHDYWRGGNRLVVLDDTHPGGDEPGTGPGFAQGDDIKVRSFQPPSLAVVPQGTGFVEVTFTWEDADLDSYAAPTLWMKSAAQDEPSKVGPVANGELLNVSVTADDADLPHQLLSAWIFELRMSSPDPMPLRFKGEVSLKVEAVRALELPLFPAHPDHWKGANEILLVEASGVLSYWEDTTDQGCNGTGCPQVVRPEVGAIVPPDAAAVRIEFTFAPVQAPGVPAAFGYEVHFHGAASREFTMVASGSGSGSNTAAPSAAGMTDGPYAKQSLWEFLVLPKPTGPLRTAWESEWTLRATALKSLDEGATSASVPA